jgi:hypothetical protein
VKLAYKDSERDVPNGSRNGPNEDLVHIPILRKITRHAVGEFALGRYRACGRGINFSDIEDEFGCNKKKSQHLLKRSCDDSYDLHGKLPPVLFRSPIRTRPSISLNIKLLVIPFRCLNSSAISIISLQ